MDVSLNTIDLEYLMNPAFSNLRVQPKEDEVEVLKTDIEFYKKRIFKLTKDLLVELNFVDQKIIKILEDPIIEVKKINNIVFTVPNASPN